MVELGTLANVAEIVGAASVVAGLAYAVWEVRTYRESKRREELSRILEVAQSEAWSRAARRVFRLPDDADLGVIEEDEERGWAVNHVAISLNFIGFLIHEGVHPLEMGGRAQAGAHLALWRKIRRWVDAAEQTAGEPIFV